eukprot:TRINITY_DN512_c0_g2_i2.p1 TRINITY_DN512_c0_g2~~TRINITY_DN512_c0_g2_i2.p1  ORF type:complete len:117 (-),score=17.31 TRINITY_DN512_c0_g2_i2:151-501(-)
MRKRMEKYQACMSSDDEDNERTDDSEDTKMQISLRRFQAMNDASAHVTLPKHEISYALQASRPCPAPKTHEHLQFVRTETSSSSSSNSQAGLVTRVDVTDGGFIAEPRRSLTKDTV